jgi:hypothetical protein
MVVDRNNFEDMFSLKLGIAPSCLESRLVDTGYALQEFG